jgi:hypothetical protein
MHMGVSGLSIRRTSSIIPLNLCWESFERELETQAQVHLMVAARHAVFNWKVSKDDGERTEMVPQRTLP